VTDGTRLLDVNVLVALLWPPHVHHEAVLRWFERIRDGGWASCPITQLGCVRVLAAPAVSQGSLTVQTAAGLLSEVLMEPHHEFWPDDLEISDNRFGETLTHFQGSNQITDRYLLALAAAHRGILATLDRSTTTTLPANSPLLEHIELVRA